VQEDVSVVDVDPLAGVVALQLVPGNLHYLQALNGLAAFAARERSHSDPAAIIADYESREGRALSQMRALFGGFIAVEVPFFEHTYLVLEGLNTDAGVVVRHLLPAIFGRHRHRFPSEFVRNVQACAHLLLMTSDYLAAHMMLKRYTTAPPSAALVTLDDASCMTLARALTLDEDEFFEGLPGALIAYLHGMFFADSDVLPAWDGNDVDESLISHPFVRTRAGKVVIAAPHDLMVTLRHAICLEARRYDCHAQLQEALTAHAAHLTRNLCESLFDDDPIEEISTGLTLLRGAFDTDKTLEIRSHIPSLEGSSSAVFADPLTVAAPPAQLADAGERRLTLDVFWMLGRDFNLLTPNEDHHLCTTFEDLETILFTSGTHKLSLWYFAEALDRLNDNDTTVLHSGLADVYGLYEESDESFYAGDDSPPPTALVVESDYSEALRVKIAQRLGRRFVHIANVVHESFPVHGASTSVCEVFAPPRVIFSAEFPDFTIWVELRARSDADGIRLRSIAESLAYWAYQIYQVEPKLFSTFGHEVQLLLLETECFGDDDDRWIRHGADVDGKDLTFEFKAPSKPERSSVPNALDRDLVAAVLSSLRHLAGMSHPDHESDPLLEVLAPPGERRMLHTVQSDVDLIAWPGALPPARTVSGAVISKLLDELGAHLRLDCGRPIGDVPPNERTAVLNNEVVAHLRERLMTDLTTYDGTALLKFVICANESLLHHDYVERVRYASTLACFGQDSQDVQDLAKRIAKTTTASVSSRFLIELIAAIQPSSIAVPTLEKYDSLLGIASEIVNKGFLSDAIHTGLSHVELSILPSGRLGIGRDDDRYIQGLQSLMSANAQAVINDAARQATWDPNDDASADDDFPLADSLAAVEWGFSFTELALFTSELINLSTELDQQDVGRLTVQAIRERMESKFAWNEEKITALLDELTMTREADFWALGSEVFPWRYNRARSYLRRPLVAYVSAGVDHVMFGHRNTLRTSFELHGQYVSGRLKARTSGMKAALSAAKDRKGDRFEDRVAEEFGRWCETVRRRVRRLGDHDFRNIEGRNLGDIDIVAFHDASQTLYLVEAKALLVARTPREMANEIAALIDGQGSAVERLGTRHEFVAGHLPEVLPALGIRADDPSVTALIVVDVDLLSARFNSAYQIVPVAKLKELMD
jgi:hypothetical protein